MKKEGFVFIPGKEEVMSGRLRVRYNCHKNEYYVGALEIISQQKIFSGGWDSVVYSYQDVQRTVDKDTDQVYLERASSKRNARVSWKFDFSTTGLVLDRLSMKMCFDESGGGSIPVFVSGDSGIKWEPYLSAGMYTSFKSLHGSNTLMITANLIGQTSYHVTRIMSQSMTDTDCPFDLQIRLKRPEFTNGRSLIFLGLMYSKETEEQKKRKKKSKKQYHNADGLLHIHVQNAKRLPCRRNGTYAEPKVKCNLHSSEFSYTVKTKALNKTLNPIWNEHLTINNIPDDTLNVSHLELQVIHSKRTLARPKELLGYVKLQKYQLINCNLSEDNLSDGLPSDRNNNSTHLHVNQRLDFDQTVSETSLTQRRVSDTNEKKNDQMSSPNQRKISNTSSNKAVNTSQPQMPYGDINIRRISTTQNNGDDSSWKQQKGDKICNGGQQYGDKLKHYGDELKQYGDKLNNRIVNLDNNNKSSNGNIDQAVFDDDQIIHQNLVIKRLLTDTVPIETTGSDGFGDLGDPTQETEGLSAADEEGRFDSLVSEVSSEVNESKQIDDNDLENISFRNSYYQNMLNDTQYTEAEEGLLNNNTSQTDDDETFEILPSFNTLTHDIENETRNCNEYLKDCTENIKDDDNVIQTLEHSPKRRTISVDNSVLYSGTNYTLRSFNAPTLIVENDEITEDNEQDDNKRGRSQSESDVIGKKQEKRRRKISNLFTRNGSDDVTNALEISYYDDKVNRLSHKHWSVVLANPSQWFYCWHPLQGAEMTV